MFEWDDGKNRRNIAKHGVDFEVAIRIFAGPVLTALDDRTDYGEARFVSVGSVGGAAILTVVHTDRDGIVRLISARGGAGRKGCSMSKRYARALTVEELAALPAEEIDFSDIPELGDAFFRNARLVMPTGKTQLTLRIDADVLAWFRAQGKGYQSRMNAVLRAYVATQREE